MNPESSQKSFLDFIFFFRKSMITQFYYLIDGTKIHIVFIDVFFNSFFCFENNFKNCFFVENCFNRLSFRHRIDNLY